MISDTDRSGWFGASDTSMVIAKNRQTRSFIQWWSVKRGDVPADFTGNRYTRAGDMYEHPILLSIDENIRLDHQIKIEDKLLRVNYDGDKNGVIYEVKTHKAENDFEVSKKYWRQAQVEMYAYQMANEDFKELYIASYGLHPDEYDERVPVDFNRVRFTPVEYDKNFIKNEYLPKLKELARCLRKGKIPR